MRHAWLAAVIQQQTSSLFSMLLMKGGNFMQQSPPFHSNLTLIKRTSDHAVLAGLFVLFADLLLLLPIELDVSEGKQDGAGDEHR